MRIHLGHHFYGAGNLGDDFMLAGFLAALRTAAPRATFTCCIPFELGPARARFPEIEWLPYTDSARADAIAHAHAWLGLGGSPFQHAQSRWFVDHLTADAALCARADKPMFFLGVGVQSTAELADPAVRAIVAQAQRIWTRDAASAERLRASGLAHHLAQAADLAHILFSNTSPPPAAPGRAALVANFDYHAWPGQAACLAALDQLAVRERLWLAQEQRPLPGAERALHAALAPALQSRWPLVVPDTPGAPLAAVLARWPSAEFLVTARYHAAIAGAWAGSKLVVIATNEKLRGIAAEFGLPLISPDATEAAVAAALAHAQPVPRATLSAASLRAAAAVAEFAQAASSSAPH